MKTNERIGETGPFHKKRQFVGLFTLIVRNVERVGLTTSDPGPPVSNETHVHSHTRGRDYWTHIIVTETRGTRHYVTPRSIGTVSILPSTQASYESGRDFFILYDEKGRSKTSLTS